MKKLSLSIVAAMLVVGLSGGVSYAGAYFERDRHQEKRIYPGLRKGWLTPREARHLFQEREKIRRAYRMALRDGRFTPVERRRIQMLREKLSRQIYRLNNNHRTRAPEMKMAWERRPGRPTGRDLREFRGTRHGHKPPGLFLHTR